MNRHYTATNIGELRTVLHDVPDDTPLVQVNPVNKEGTVDLYLDDSNGTLRVLIYEG